jgi:hypothetical protein
MEILKIRDHLGNQGIDGGLLKYTIKTSGVRMRSGPYGQRRAVTNKTINLQIP